MILIISRQLARQLGDTPPLKRRVRKIVVSES